jgi:hypothetical protein
MTAVKIYKDNRHRPWKVINIPRNAGRQLRLSDYKNAIVEGGNIQEKKIDVLSQLQCEGLVNTLLLKRNNSVHDSPETSIHDDFDDGNGNTVNGANNGDEVPQWLPVRSPAYKAINHFRELLNRIQGRSLCTVTNGCRERTRIPPESIEAIQSELSKRRLNMPTLHQVRECMRVTGNNRYYGELYSLWAKANGRTLPQFTWQQEQKLCSMFTMVQNAYAKCKPKGRKNFLSYTYTLFKLCELLEYDSLLSLISLLKSDEKLRTHDTVWREICTELRWEYIPTVRHQ